MELRSKLEQLIGLAEEIGVNAKKNDTNDSILVVAKVEDKDGPTAMALGMCGSFGNIAEMLVRTMIDNKEFADAIQAAAGTYRMLPLFDKSRGQGPTVREDGKICDCPACTRAAANQQQ